MARITLRTTPQAIVHRAHNARRELLLLIPLTIAVVFAYLQRDELFGVDRPARIAAAGVLVVLGAALARDIGRSLAPALFRRMDAPTAGTVGFLIRLAFLTITVVVALRLAGLDPQTLAVGGAITAVIVGLAAQQTFGNVFAGLVLTSARPLKVGDRVRLQAGGVAGQLEGDVTSIGLLYTTFAQGDDVMLVPNTIVLSAAVVPLREPAGVDLRVRLRPDVRVTEVQRLLRERVTVPVRGEAHIALEELDADEVVVRVSAVPDVDTEGPQLADEILQVMEAVTRAGHTEERRVVRRLTRV
jgi:small-conductance mechanosensitive channel